MIVDAHVHIERKDDGTLYTPAEIVKAMDAGGIDVSVVFGNDQGDAGTRPVWAAGEIPVSTNFSDDDTAAFCREFPKRLAGVASVHPSRLRPELKIRRAVEELGLKGVKLYPHSGFCVNDRRLYPMYEFCQEAGVPVIMHTGMKAVRWQHMKYNNPINADDVATDFPGLQIVLCHGGYPWVEEFMAVVGTNPNITVDLTFMDYIEDKFQVPNLIENTVRRLNSIIGAKRIIWGSEGPVMNLPLFGSHVADNYRKCQERLVRRFDFLSDSDKSDILGGNAKRLFIK